MTEILTNDDVDPLEERLRHAIEKRSAAERRLVDLRAAEARGAEMVRDAVAELAACGDPAGEIEEARAERSAAAILGTDMAVVMPDRARLKRKAELEEKLRDLRAGQGRVAAAARVAANELAVAQGAVQAAAAAVIFQAAADLADDWRELQDKADALRLRLYALGRTRVLSRLPREVAAAIDGYDQPYPLHGLPEAEAAWKRWYDELLAGDDAHL
jgi:hypothetical protein